MCTYIIIFVLTPINELLHSHSLLTECDQEPQLWTDWCHEDSRWFTIFTLTQAEVSLHFTK